MVGAVFLELYGGPVDGDVWVVHDTSYLSGTPLFIPLQPEDYHHGLVYQSSSFGAYTSHVVRVARYVADGTVNDSHNHRMRFTGVGEL